MVHIRMPRFSLGYSASLRNSLGRIGLGSIFDSSQADFSEMSSEERLSISSMTHK
jgi:serine protease inhibitor